MPQAGTQVQFDASFRDEMREAMKEIRDLAIRTDEHVTLYLGNAKPGLIPEQLTKLSNTVEIHSEYIAEQRGSSRYRNWIVGIVITLVSSSLAAYAVTIMVSAK